MRDCLKILVLAQYFPPDMGGASTRASNVVKGLLSKDCEVKVVAAFPHYPHGKVPRKYRHKAIVSKKAGDAKVLRVWIPALPHNSIANRVILHFCFVLSSLFALPFVGDFDVVWAANPNLFCFFPALLYGLTKRKPIVRNVDDLWPEVFYEMGIVRSRLMRMVLDFLAKLSYIVPAAITPISDGYKRRIVKRYGVLAEKVYVVEVGVDSVKSLVPDNSDKSQFVVMYSGLLGVGYDFETVLKAASCLWEYGDIVFLIRGIGELVPQLRRLIGELDLRNVVLDTNFLNKKKLSALLKTADAFLLPMSPASFMDEGLPTKVFEYQAYGKPIVCCSEGESARYVQTLRSGLVVKPGDSEAVAEAVLKLYRDRKLAWELGWNGWKHVSNNLTSKRIGERIHKVFLLTKRQPTCLRDR